MWTPCDTGTNIAGLPIVQINRPRMRLADLARWALHIDQQVVDQCVGEACKAGATISCRKSCGACCRQVVPLSLPEAWMVAEMVDAFPAGRQQEVRGRFASIRGVLEANGLVHCPLLDRATDYFVLSVPCPFLELESCSIHSHRPAACREYLVTSPAANCTTLNGGAAIVAMPISMTTILASVAARLLKTAPTLVPMARTLDWARFHAANNRRDWDSRYLIQTLLDVSTGRS